MTDTIAVHEALYSHHQDHRAVRLGWTATRAPEKPTIAGTITSDDSVSATRNTTRLPLMV